MSECVKAGIRCPCCRGSVRGDVWYDCRCFLGRGKKTCPNCRLPKAEQDEKIAATMREWGWDKAPSPGMLDYLTPGWRKPSGVAESLVEIDEDGVPS